MKPKKEIIDVIFKSSKLTLHCYGSFNREPIANIAEMQPPYDEYDREDYYTHVNYPRYLFDSLSVGQRELLEDIANDKIEFYSIDCVENGKAICDYYN